MQRRVGEIYLCRMPGREGEIWEIIKQDYPGWICRKYDGATTVFIMNNPAWWEKIEPKSKNFNSLYEKLQGE